MAPRPCRRTACRSGSFEPPRSGPVDARAVAAPAVHANAVVTPRGLGRHIAVVHVAPHRLGISLRGSSPASTATAHDRDDFAGRDRMLGRLAYVTSGSIGRCDLDAIHRAIESTAKTPRRRRFALEAEGDEARFEELIDALDAEAAAELAGATRIRPKTVFQNPHRWHARLDDLDRIVARGRAREDDHRRLAVVRRPRAGAPRVEIALDEELARLRVRAERDGRHLVAV